MMHLVFFLLQATPLVSEYDSSQTVVSNAITPEKFIEAAGAGNIEGMEQYIKEGGDVNAALKGNYALNTATQAKKDNAVELLISSNANPNSQNKAGNTPLAMVVRTGNMKIFNLLISALKNQNLSLDVANNKGVTPLMLACVLGRVEMVEALLEAGADPMLKNQKGETALDYLERSNCEKSKLPISTLLDKCIQELRGSISSLCQDTEH